MLKKIFQDQVVQTPRILLGMLVMMGMISLSIKEAVYIRLALVIERVYYTHLLCLMVHVREEK